MANPRLFISTDMQMMTGVNHVAGDKDDVQSLVHALMYQDKIDIVGIASSTSRHQPGANSAAFIHRVIDAYAEDQPQLAARSSAFKTAEELHDITYQGTKTLAGGSGVVAPNEASNAIIEAARAAEAAGEPLYVATWGGLGDVARALHDAPDIAGVIRLLSASGPKQEPNAYAYLREEFAGEGELWWLDAQSTQVGIYANPKGKTADLDNGWAVRNAKDHGALGAMFFENTLDVKGKLDEFDAVKMGDSFSVFYLIDGLAKGDPTTASWAGQYRKVDDGYWTDRTDIRFDWSGSHGVPTTYEHRAAWQADFAERFDWLKGGAAPPPDAGKGADLTGGSGDDLLDGRDGAEALAGGRGDDVYYVDRPGQEVTEAAGAGHDMTHSWVSWTLSANVEDLALRGPVSNGAVGNELKNLITGNSGANNIRGEGGDDRLEGRGSWDTIVGGAGDDLLIGGPGDDWFVFGPGDGDDTIADYAPGGRGDRIVINGHDHYSLRQKGEDTLVSFGDVSVLLKNVQAGSLTSADFLFF